MCLDFIISVHLGVRRNCLNGHPPLLMVAACVVAACVRD